MASDECAIEVDPFATGATGTGANPIEISYNQIFNGARSLIVFRSPDAYVNIEGNNLYNFGLQCADCGGTYTHGEGTTTGDLHSSVEYNIIHDGFAALCCGVFLDNGHYDVTVSHNIMFSIAIGINSQEPPANTGEIISNNTIDQSIDNENIAAQQFTPSMSYPDNRYYITPYEGNGVETVQNDLDTQAMPSVKPGFAQYWMYSASLPVVFENYQPLPVVGSISPWF
jgi:hypothetical protein